MTTEIKVRPWLLVVLATVTILGGGYTYWNMKGGKNIISPTTSPTPTKSVVVSPSASASTSKTSTPSTTTTPTNNESNSSATPAPKSTTPTIPDGWKYDSQTLRAHGTLNTGRYTMLIKNDWMINSTNTANPELQQYALGSQADCGSNWEWPGCAVVVTFNWSSTTTENNVYWTKDHKGYFTLTFPNNNLSESDKKMVTDHFFVDDTSQF